MLVSLRNGVIFAVLYMLEKGLSWKKNSMKSDNNYHKEFNAID